MVPRGTLRTHLRTVLGPIVLKLEGRWEHLGSPVWSAVRTLEHRVAALEAAATRLSDGIQRQDEVAAVAPLLLDAAATQHAGLRAAARRDHEVWDAIRRGERRLGEIEQRLEVARREVLFELRYGRDDGWRPAPLVEHKILDQEKVESMRGALRLNVGSGSLAVEGYVNVDGRAINGVDVVAEVGDLPFDDGTVEEVRSAHVLEHFPKEELRRRVLPHWVAKLRPGGTFRAIVPDAVSMMDAWSEGTLTFEDLREVTFGGQDYEGDFHFTMFSVDSLTALLEGAGLVDVRVVEAGRRNGLCLEMELVAFAPEGGRHAKLA